MALQETSSLKIVFCGFLMLNVANLFNNVLISEIP